MDIEVAERRQHVRLSASHAVSLWDRRGRMLLRSRTGDISETGLLVLVTGEQAARVPEWIVVEVALPDISFRGRGRSTRLARYNAHVMHRSVLGQMIGLGIELIGKAA